FLDNVGAAVVHDALVAPAQQAPHHVGAHPAQTDHPELHDKLLSLGFEWFVRASLRPAGRPTAARRPVARRGGRRRAGSSPTHRSGGRPFTTAWRLRASTLASRKACWARVG